MKPKPRKIAAINIETAYEIFQKCFSKANIHPGERLWSRKLSNAISPHGQRFAVPQREYDAYAKYLQNTFARIKRNLDKFRRGDNTHLKFTLYEDNLNILLDFIGYNALPHQALG